MTDNEQKILDTALLESDQLLARSLRDDERRRKRKRFVWWSVFVFGGASMFVLILAIVFGGFTLGLPEKAEAKGKRPTREMVEQAESLAAEGWQLWKRQDLLAAAEKFEASVELNPKAANAWNGYGWALFNSGQSTKALEAFKKCVKLSPKHPAGLNGLGQIYFSRGKYQVAERYLKKAAKNPYASAAWYGLTKVYLLTGEFKKALPWAKKTAKSSPKDEYAQQMLAAAKSGELDDELRRIIEPLVDEDLENEEAMASAQEGSDSEADSEEEPSQQGADEGNQQWRTRLLTLKEGGNWSEGAEVGMELVRIPGDRPFEILEANWSEIATSARKQILKGFTPGMMGNEEIHSRFFDVMHLGMTDPDAGVREYAAVYIEMQGLPNFTQDAEGYARWYEKNKDRAAKEIVGGAR